MGEDEDCREDRPVRMRPCCIKVKKMVKERRMFFGSGRRLQGGQAGEDASLLPRGPGDGEGDGEMEVDDERTQGPADKTRFLPLEIHMTGHARFSGRRVTVRPRLRCLFDLYF
jgi:hypothetical protein